MLLWQAPRRHRSWPTKNKITLQLANSSLVNANAFSRAFSGSSCLCNDGVPITGLGHQGEKYLSAGQQLCQCKCSTTETPRLSFSVNIYVRHTKLQSEAAARLRQFWPRNDYYLRSVHSFMIQSKVYYALIHFCMAMKSMNPLRSFMFFVFVVCLRNAFLQRAINPIGLVT